MFFVIKLLTSAAIIAGVSEIAKKSSFLAAFLISLPIVSILSFVWIYIENKDAKQIQALSWEVFYLVIPSLLFFVALPLGLKHGLNFWVAMLLATLVTSIGYFIVSKVVLWA